MKTPDDAKIRFGTGAVVICHSMKTGYGKYIGVNAEGQLIAVAEAIGTRERFIPVFQEVSYHFFKNMDDIYRGSRRYRPV